MKRFASLLILVVIAGSAHRAAAVPAFARKYKTSCTTCHTIFPKLNPFGEQFRRNGFRFPGIDSDVVKAEPVPLGTDAQKKTFPESVWPGLLSSFPPLAIGMNGQAIFHPDRGSSGGVADNGAAFNVDGLVEEAHLWAAGSIDDSITFYSELTAADGGLELETAALFFNDLVGPAHAVNVALGKRIGSYTSFQPHGSYFADMMIPQVPVTGLYGATSDPFVFNDNHQGIEINGVVADDRLSYSAGLVAGTNVDTRNSANFYGHVGYKIGGATLDGENTGGVTQDIEHEHAITLDAFMYRSVSRFNDAGDATAMPPVDPALTKDIALTFGGAIRAQLSELELDSGLFFQTDDHVNSTAPTTSTLSQWNEFSYLLYPWLAVGGRAEYLRVAQEGGTAVSDLRIVPGVVALVRPNLKFTLTAPIEQAMGAPDAGWGAAGLAAAPADVNTKVTEIESVQLQLWAAF